MNTQKINTPFKLSLLSLALAASTQVQADDSKIETIEVTATKRVQSIQEIPASISAISANDIKGLKIRSGGDIAAAIPNLQSTNIAGDGFPIFSLRGVSMSDYSFNQNSPVASYVDEVYKGSPAIQGVQIFDLERIEVLRGPQGTLYGKNSTGGAVNFITQKPDLATTGGGEFTFGLGSNNRQEANGAVDLPIIADKLAVRVAGSYVKADGWQENKLKGVDDGSAIDEYGLRATFAYQPNDDLEVVLRLATSEQEAVNYGVVPFNISEGGVGGGVYGLYNALGGTDKTDDYREGLDYHEFESETDLKRKIETKSAVLTINYDINDELTLTSISSYDDGDILNPEDADGTSLEVATTRYYADADQFTQDLRITSNYKGDFNFIAGLYFSNEDSYNQTSLGFYQDIDLNLDGNRDYMDCLDVTFTALAGAPMTDAGVATEAILNDFGLSLGALMPAGCSVENEFDQERESKAIYFDGNYDINEALTLRFGARHTDDEVTITNFSARLRGNDGTPLLNTIPYDEADPFAKMPSDSIDDKKWTGKLGVDYKAEDGTLYYASYSTGFRSGSYNAQAFFDPSEFNKVDSEELDSIELGLKTNVFDDKVQLNMSVFDYSYDNQQFLNVDPQTLAQTLVNIDESSVQGLEIESKILVTSSTMLNIGLGLLDSEVDKGMLSGVNLKGNDLIMSPSVDANISLDTELFENDYGFAKLRLETTYTGSQNFDVFNLDRMEEDGYWLANARFEFHATDNWYIGVWSKNLTDEEYRTSAVDLSSLGYDYGRVGQDRSFGVDFSYEFY